MDIPEIALQILLKAMDTKTFDFQGLGSLNQEKNLEWVLNNVEQINQAYNSIYDNLYSKIIIQK